MSREQIGGRIVTDGLVLMLDAGNEKSYPGTGTTWSDLSGNGNNGTLVNGVGYDSGNGGSLTFDGSNDYVELNTTLSSTIDETLSATYEVWANVVSSTSNRVIFGNAWVNGGFHLRLTGTSHSPANRVRFLYFTNGSNGTGVDSIDTFTTGIYNFTVTYNGNGLSYSNFLLYVNGITTFTTNPTFGNPTTIPSRTINVGAISAENTAYYNSNIYSIKVYNRALTADEVLQNFNATRGRFGI